MAIVISLSLTADTMTHQHCIIFGGNFGGISNWQAILQRASALSVLFRSAHKLMQICQPVFLWGPAAAGSIILALAAFACGVWIKYWQGCASKKLGKGEELLLSAMLAVAHVHCVGLHVACIK
jgi:hypothetical protein